MSAKISQRGACDREAASAKCDSESAADARARSDAWWLAVVAAASILFVAGGETTATLARYERGALEVGQVWRLFSAHFVHLGWSHLALNLTALALLRLLLGPALGAREWLVLFLLAGLVIGIGLYFLSPETEWYVGLSGILHAVAVVVSVRLFEAERGLAAALLCGLVGKIAWEQALGPSAWSIAASGGPVVVDAHLYGAVAGLACLPILRWPVMRRRL